MTIILVRATFVFCLIVLGNILCWCLIPATSFADAPLQGNRPAGSSPVIDLMLDADRSGKKDRIGDPGPIPPGGRDVCFSIGDRLGPQDNGGRTAWFLLPMTACVGLLGSVDDIGWSGYEARGDHARSVGNWSEAEQAYAKALELLDRATVQDVDQDLASLLNKLGTARFRQKDFAGAETTHRRALTIYKKIRGADDLRVADTLDLVAVALYEQQSGRELAGSLFFRAWAIREKALGPNHPDVADSLHHLALSLYSDNVSIAIPLLLRSMEIRETMFGHDHPSVADSLHAMARLYEAHNQRDLAIPLYQQALTIQEKVFGPNASETRQARSSLDLAYRGRGMDNPVEDPHTRE